LFRIDYINLYTNLLFRT